MFAFTLMMSTVPATAISIFTGKSFLLKAGEMTGGKQLVPDTHDTNCEIHKISACTPTTPNHQLLVYLRQSVFEKIDIGTTLF